MNKFFIRKEAGTVAQAADYSNPGQPSWWEKPLYALQRAVPYSFAKPTSQKMFDPKDNPEAYHADLYNMAKAREERIRERFKPAHFRHQELLEEVQRNPWRSIKLSPYMRRANHKANMLNEQLFDAGAATYRIGKPGSLEAGNTIEDIKYGKPIRY